MITLKTDEARKAEILKLLSNNDSKMYDEKFDFKFKDIFWYMKDDPAFFMDVIKILKKQVKCQDIVYYQLAYSHRNSLLKDDKFKNDRSDVIWLIKKLLFSDQNNNDRNSLKDYIFKPIGSQFVTYTNERLFEKEHRHLEYYPVINQRVFPIGGQDVAANENEMDAHKEIRNVELKSTYSKLIHLFIHQDLTKSTHLNLEIKQKMQLVYFLQL